MKDQQYKSLVECLDEIVNLLDRTNSHFTTAQSVRNRVDKLLGIIADLKKETPEDQKPSI